MKEKNREPHKGLIYKQTKKFITKIPSPVEKK